MKGKVMKKCRVVRAAKPIVESGGFVGYSLLVGRSTANSGGIKPIYSPKSTQKPFFKTLSNINHLV